MQLSNFRRSCRSISYLLHAVSYVTSEINYSFANGQSEHDEASISSIPEKIYFFAFKDPFSNIASATRTAFNAAPLSS